MKTFTGHPHFSTVVTTISDTVIGKGNHGSVFEGYVTTPANYLQKCAIKVFTNIHDYANLVLHIQNTVCEQVDITDCDYVVPFSPLYTQIGTQTKLVLVMQIVDKCTRRIFGKELLEMQKSLQSIGAFHTDIKQENIGIDRETRRLWFIDTDSICTYPSADQTIGPGSWSQLLTPLGGKPVNHADIFTKMRLYDDGFKWETKDALLASSFFSMLMTIIRQYTDGDVVMFDTTKDGRGINTLVLGAVVSRLRRKDRHLSRIFRLFLLYWHRIRTSAYWPKQ